MNIIEPKEDVKEEDDDFNIDEFEKQQALKIRQNAQRLLAARIAQKMVAEKERVKKKQDELIHAKIAQRTLSNPSTPINEIGNTFRSGAKNNDDKASFSSS